MIAKRHETVLLILTALGGVIIMKNENEYVYDIEEYSQDVRHYQITSNVKLTDEEVRSVYLECDCYDLVKSTRKKEGHSLDTFNNLTAYVEWSDERFTDDELLNKIKIWGVSKGTEYGDDCQVDITGEFEND